MHSVGHAIDMSSVGNINWLKEKLYVVSQSLGLALSRWNNLTPTCSDYI